MALSSTSAHFDVHSKHHKSNPSSQQQKRKSSTNSRMARPAPLTRRDTGKQTQKSTASAKDGSAVRQPADDDTLAATFLQFCATCEKQISVPSASVLYCSESCRSRDSASPNSYALFKNDFSPPTSPLKSPTQYLANSADIVPQRSPTVQTSPIFFQNAYGFTSDDSTSADISRSTSFGDLADRPSRNHSSSSLSTSSGTIRSRPSTFRSDSDAARYLDSFHTTHPSCKRYSTSTTAPSLVNTPISSTSVSSTPYTPSSAAGTSSRPLPPRMHPRGSSMSFGSRSVDLVTPVGNVSQFSASSENTAAQVGSDDTVRAEFANMTFEEFQKRSDVPMHEGSDMLSYEKQTMNGITSGPVDSSLKQLFQFEEMRSAPKRPSDYGFFGRAKA